MLLYCGDIIMINPPSFGLHALLLTCLDYATARPSSLLQQLSNINGVLLGIFKQLEHFYNLLTISPLVFNQRQAFYHLVYINSSQLQILKSKYVLEQQAVT